MSQPFVGEIRMFAGNFAPMGWALCDGTLLPISENDALFSLLGTTYGGDGRTTFALPDLRGRAPMHQGTGPGLSHRTIGQRIGAEAVTLTTANLPTHVHGQRATNDAADSKSPSGAAYAHLASELLYRQDGTEAPMSDATGGNTGGNQPHDNMMPYLAVNFIIALVGIYPSRG